MANNETVHRTELSKIVDDGTNNNYDEWKTRSYHKLREWGLLKYIEGPDSDPPVDPPLREAVEYHGLDEHNTVSTVRVLGNAAQHQQALANAQPWMTGNNIALSRIVVALPSHQLHLVQNVRYAKQAWESLRSVYQPQNSLRAATIKGQIMTYRCTSDMNVAQWLNDMQRLHNSLCDLDIEHTSDRDFALAILDLMPQDDGWREFISGLRAKVCDLDAQALPIDSTTFITTIRDEYWYRYKDDHQAASTIFSAPYEARKCSSTHKRPRAADLIATSISAPAPNKRARGPTPNKANLLYSNTHCGSKTGHDTADCIAYKRAKEGQYGDWWRGPRNIHLPQSQRPKDNNTTPIQSDDIPSQANSALSADTNFDAWSTQVTDSSAHTTLNPSLLHDNACHHNSGANRHVFHDRSAFEHYETITPLAVRGFGQNMSAIAIGCGTVRLEGRHNNDTCSILLNNVLHIPAARTNFISGVQLDKAGVVSTLGNNSIFLSSNGKVIVSGTVVNDMFRLNLTIIPPDSTNPTSLPSRITSPTGSPIPNSISLASRITPPSLASQISPKHATLGFCAA